MSLARRIAGNTTAIVVASFGRQLLSMAFIVLVARQLGVEDFGRYSIAMSLAVIFTTFSNFGLQNLLVREEAREKEQANRFFVRVVSMTLPASLLIWGMLVAATQLLDYDRETTLAAYIVGLTLVPYSVSFVMESLFQAMEQMRYIGYVSLTAYAVQLVLGLGVLLWQPSLLRIAGVVLTTEILMAALYLLVGHHRLAVPRRWSRGDLDFRQSAHILRQAISFILISTLSTIFLNSDVILLSKLQGEAAVGLYRAAARLMGIGFTLIFSYAAALFPIMSSLQSGDTAAISLEALTTRSLRYLVTALLWGAIVVTVLAEPMSRLIFGAQYAGMEAVLRIQIWILVPGAVSQVLSHSIFARNRQHAIPLFLLLAILLNVTLCLWWIPNWSYLAAAWSMLLAWSLVAILTFGLALRHGAANWETVAALARPCLCTVIVVTMLFIFRGVNEWALALLGTAAYGSLVLLLRVLPAEDMARLRRTVLSFASRME